VTDAAAELEDATPGGEPPSSYGSGARILSIGIAATGLFSFAYFAVASHVLNAEQYGQVALLWSVLFVVISVIYRPVEQLLSRSIADRRARGLHSGHPLRVPLSIQGGFAVLFLAAALALRPQLEDLFGGSASLYWIFVGAALAYAASYFARGYFAGHQWFALYGGLVLFESISRFCFPVAVAVGIASGQTAVALGILAAPLASLLVIPWAIARHRRLDARAPEPDPSMTMRAGAGFAVAVAGIQLGEQTLLNAGVIVADAVSSAAVAGAIFNVLLITRAPLQLFQAVQTSLLPHLAGLEATEGADEFRRAIRVTVAAIAAFAGAVALGLLLVGPWVMHLVFGDDTDYGRVGLAIVAVGMGLHLVAGTFNQAALARGQARVACAIWLICAALFVVWVALPVVDDVLLRAEVGYAGASALLCLLLYGLYRRGAAAP
jgi:O-antigen/teichoic acid export membrane protein